MISLTNVTITHGRLPVVLDASLTIEQGEIVLLTGETGAGKTSLLRALYGDLPILSGHGVVDGVQLRPLVRKEIPKLRRRMGLIFQDDKLLEDRSVYDNIRFALSIQMKSSREITRTALTILAELGLSHIRSQHPNELSAGEAQRIGIARALANEPTIVIADEPTGDLDTDTTGEIFEYLSRRHTAEKISIIATHDLPRARESFPSARHVHLADGNLHERQ